MSAISTLDKHAFHTRYIFEYTRFYIAWQIVQRRDMNKKWQSHDFIDLYNHLNDIHSIN